MDFRLTESVIETEFTIDNETICDLVSNPRNWPMPFFDNFHITATDKEPTFAGFYRNLGSRNNNSFAGGWCLRFSDGYYNMVLNFQKAGQLPRDKNGNLKLRCKVRICRAKSLVSCVDDELLTPENYKKLRDSALWAVHPFKDIPHTCNQKVDFFYADRRNFGEDYREFEKQQNDSNTAWKMAQNQWTSGLGAEYDGMFQGTKLSHSHKLEWDRTISGPSNKNVSTPIDLNIPENVKFIETTIFPENAIPFMELVPFFREIDEFGNMYFQTKQDSASLLYHDSYFCDATYSPIRGSKMFKQVFIISVKEELTMSARPTVLANPVSWILMTGKTTEHYISLFKTVKKIAKEDQTDGPKIDLNPLFIYADA